MKVVTFNIRCDFGQDGDNNYSFREPLILTAIEREKPDIICFQEMLPHVAARLKEKLPDYYITGCGRDRDFGDEQTAIAYRKLQFNLLDLEIFWLSETPALPGSRFEEQSECPRTCTRAVLLELHERELIRIYNTHLDHIGTRARELGLSLILKHMEEDSRFSQAPAVLAGDMNALPNSPELLVLKEQGKLRELTEDIKGTFHDYGAIPGGEKLDYIFADRKLGFNGVSIWTDCENGVYLSDHYPVCAIVMI